VKPSRVQGGRTRINGWTCLTAVLLGIASLCDPVAARSQQVAPFGTVILRGQGWDRNYDTSSFDRRYNAGFDRRYDTTGIDLNYDRNYNTNGFDRSFDRSGLSRP
jgi:hypothetical protein